MSSAINNAIIKDDLLLVKRLVEKKGFRMTKQRKLILEQFFTTKGHIIGLKTLTLVLPQYIGT